MRNKIRLRLGAVSRLCLAAMTPVVSPYGSWDSPLKAEVLSSSRVAMSDLRSVDGRLYWTETMPTAGGISGLFSAAKGNAGTRISPEGAVRCSRHQRLLQQLHRSASLFARI